MTTEILRLLGPSCRDATRRSLIVATSIGGVNGIDFVEYRQSAAPPHHVLEVHFLRTPAPSGLVAEDFVIAGGTRIVDIRPTGDPIKVGGVLELPINAQGDFSQYVLSVAWSRQTDGTWRFDDTKRVDRLFSVAGINFRAGCPVDFDCAPREVCPPEPTSEPTLDYLAKDYASFRQLLLDVVAQRNPRWIERNPADLAIALLELFAHEGDHLSYFQDAVANEAYLDTARHRVSAKRHAKLVDYVMHDGRNAWTHVFLEVSSDGTLPVGQQLLTRITTPLRHQDAPPGAVVDKEDVDFDADPVLVRAHVFETATELRASTLNNIIRLHTWGNDQCCLARGTVTAHLYAVDSGKAVLPKLGVDDYVLLEEVRGPETGDPADADPAHRAVVQIVAIDDKLFDPVFRAALSTDGELQVRSTAAQNPLPLLGVTWRLQDALTFPLCLSATRADGSAIRRISVARGNVVLADHGRTASDELRIAATLRSDAPVRLRLSRSPLTMQCQPEKVAYDGMDTVMTTPRPDLACDVRAAKAAVALRITGASSSGDLWTVVPDLLASSSFDRHFVADVENDGTATLRFGDGEYGSALSGATTTAVYRVGNGTAGNIGADALAHIILPKKRPPNAPAITTVRNPLPARDGTDPETIEQVRHYAPAAFRARQLRAVTEADYRDAAVGISGVAGAVAAFRWTGSWYTVYVGIDPQDPTHVLTAPGGGTRLAREFALRVHAGLTRSRLAGYDLELRTAQYVPLRIEIELCVAPDHFRGDVTEAVRSALGAGTGRTGRTGLFHPDRWTFGQSVYLSQLYATVAAVEGVGSLEITTFHRFGRDPAGERDAGVIPIGPWEIARLDNDPNRMENGLLIVTAGGGK